MVLPAYHPVGFDQLEGWRADHHEPALKAFANSLAALERKLDGGPYLSDLRAHCRAAAALVSEGPVDRDRARHFFETRFIANAVRHDGADGLLTGYYEPVLAGSRIRSAEFPVPLLRRPPDLVTLVDDHLRGVAGVGLTHGRKTDEGVVPYPTRREIECGALDAMGLEMMWLADPVDAFFLHVQGSGLIRLADGRGFRVGYDGKNGHPYTSVGSYLAGRGEMRVEEVTLDRLKAWLYADPVRGREAMWQNQSYIFFRELGPEAEVQAVGVNDIPLTTGRSLAVDAGCHEIGLPIFVAAPSLRIGAGDSGFARLMVAQDVGSAIRGPERGDIFYGVGDEAGRLAGTTKHRGNFFVLSPRASAETAPA